MNFLKNVNLNQSYISKCTSKFFARQNTCYVRVTLNESVNERVMWATPIDKIIMLAKIIVEEFFEKWMSSAVPRAGTERSLARNAALRGLWTLQADSAFTRIPSIYHAFMSRIKHTRIQF
jgi:hypothetical protein